MLNGSARNGARNFSSFTEIPSCSEYVCGCNAVIVFKGWYSFCEISIKWVFVYSINFQASFGPLLTKNLETVYCIICVTDYSVGFQELVRWIFLHIWSRYNFPYRFSPSIRNTWFISFELTTVMAFLIVFRYKFLDFAVRGCPFY